MKLFNYLKLFGAFTNAQQVIALPVEPKDRQEKKMLEEANRLVDAGWTRRQTYLESRELEGGEAVDLDAEKAAFYPKVEDGTVFMPLQYVQDFMVRKMAAIQNNVSIHNTKDVADLKEIFGDYNVELTASFKGLVFDFINWTAKPGQKPKLLVHAKEADGEEVVIRFEAAGELCQKFMMALLELKLQPGQAFDLSVEAVDPAIEKNRRAGKKVADTGLYVNHNMVLTVGGKTHSGHPPKGTRFVQKPTIEYMEALFRQAQDATLPKQKAA
ncbi:hypothetical protein WJ96_04885 [Burkholderia ubonensis]|uniref:Uncharacterized protein n=1 Tax=Burkholderia ubonensis TaxID=101571 RepID=A0AAW3MQR9_9BURK|nr:hypothetical protein [Burkholderia ubonensis]KVP97909.1 hypothetical protein WJ96_04885 [Burkholderia ubonensis]KVZ92606.1 hypothetical protein WL25_16540 [Burkholderia ubonensis]